MKIDSTKAEEARIIRERDDVAMINRPEMWPNWPFLPVKKRQSQEPNIGVISDALWPGMEGKITVVLCNLHTFDAKAPKLTYDSAEACVADGWVVD